MLTIETIATVDESGTLKAKAPATLAKGQHRVVIVVEDAPASDEPLPREGFPDLASFRERLGPAYPGDTIVEMRQEERS
jgi:hypothetical protein